ncbi:metal-dependent hydrolase [Fictibacillus enclensis]|uniref:metal-dependent hydrolase n=1 Tax=Fictibacillus enclensis TaxID=1017270 RepID=UPI0025A16042|nr:metal-dependent hydrolase [Fictibacillus enclensis]MDM5335769.1 metal-dependent hydrolase [Fictibacillus enclensis]
MQYRTHLATSLVVSLPIMAATDTLTVASITAVGLGAVFPDIDEPHSWIGCRTRGISDFLNKVFGHRGITHSLLGILIVFLTIVLMVNLSEFRALTGLFFLLGYALHIIEDSFSKSGVKWFVPFSDQKFQSGMGMVWYRTGSFIENLIFLGSVAVIILQIKASSSDFHLIMGEDLATSLSELLSNVNSFIAH